MLRGDLEITHNLYITGDVIAFGVPGNVIVPCRPTYDYPAA